MTAQKMQWVNHYQLTVARMKYKAAFHSKTVREYLRQADLFNTGQRFYGFAHIPGCYVTSVGFAGRCHRHTSRQTSSQRQCCFDFAGYLNVIVFLQVRIPQRCSPSCVGIGWSGFIFVQFLRGCRCQRLMVWKYCTIRDIVFGTGHCFWDRQLCHFSTEISALHLL